MSRGTSLRLSDVARVHDLLGECREQRDHPDAWRRHLVTGITRLVGARVGYYVFGSPDPINGSPGKQAVSVGWSSDEERDWIHREAIYRPLPETHPGMVNWFKAAPKRGYITTSLHGCFDNPGGFEESITYDLFHLNTGINGMSMSTRITAEGVDHLCASRDRGDRPMTLRHERILNYLHRRLTPMVGTSLVTEDQSGRHLLTPRENEVLDYLLEGASEKEIASALHRARPTVHRHVVAIYEKLGMNSRGELLAFFLRQR